MLKQPVISDTPSAVVEEIRLQLNAALDVFDTVAASYTDTSATPGDGTADTLTGRSSIAIGDDEAIITNAYVSATSVVHATLESLDATAIRIKCVPGTGAFTVTANATATAVTKFRWSVVTPSLTTAQEDLASEVKKVTLKKAMPTGKKLATEE